MLRRTLVPQRWANYKKRTPTGNKKQQSISSSSPASYSHHHVDRKKTTNTTLAPLASSVSPSPTTPERSATQIPKPKPVSAQFPPQKQSIKNNAVDEASKPATKPFNSKALMVALTPHFSASESRRLVTMQLEILRLKAENSSLIEASLSTDYVSTKTKMDKLLKNAEGKRQLDNNKHFRVSPLAMETVNLSENASVEIPLTETDSLRIVQSPSNGVLVALEERRSILPVPVASIDDLAGSASTATPQTNKEDRQFTVYFSAMSGASPYSLSNATSAKSMQVSYTTSPSSSSETQQSSSSCSNNWRAMSFGELSAIAGGEREFRVTVM